MLKKKLILSDPLKFLVQETNNEIINGCFGAVASRAGVGKTSFLVQIAISSLIKEKKVLHISIQNPVDKINLWYQEIFSHLTRQFETKQSKQLWEHLVSHRFIMTFETESFDFSKLKIRIEELKTQNIFVPHLVIIDGLSFDESILTELDDFKKFAKSHDLTTWFSVRMHRHQMSDNNEMMEQIYGQLSDLFNIIIQLVPEKEQIQIKWFTRVKDINNHRNLFLDPATMLIKENPAR